MNASRRQMLQRIRNAVIEGNRAGGSPSEPPERGQIGYQGADADLLARFRTEFSNAGGQLHVVSDAAAAAEVILDLVRSRSIHRAILGRSNLLDALSMSEPLKRAGVDLREVTPDSSESKEGFAAEVGLSAVDYLIAETGSIVLASRPEQPRSLSLLPPIHIAVAERRQLLPDLFDLFAALGTQTNDLPACLSIITGPSKTGDIELRLVTGVHGPGEVHVVLIGAEA